MPQLISYIAPGAPATRRVAGTALPFLRPEAGFTPQWYRNILGIDFGEPWHTDPVFRKTTRQEMYGELDRRFPGKRIGRLDNDAMDILTGTYGASAIAAVYGVEIRYSADQWPVSEHQYLSENEIENLTPPNLDNNPFFLALMQQVDQIALMEGKIEGFINWQGVLNNAQRLRGQDIFMDMYLAPERTLHLLNCVCTTMIEAAQRLWDKKRVHGGSGTPFFTVSNCLVNMVEPELYNEFILPFDQKIALAFGLTGIHNCAWNASPYIESYAQVPQVGYIDMGMDSDLQKARESFQGARRAIMYTPMDLANKTLEQLKTDMEHIANNYGPCDVVVADIEAGTPDGKVMGLFEICEAISKKHISM